MGLIARDGRTGLGPAELLCAGLGAKLKYSLENTVVITLSQHRNYIVAAKITAAK